MNAKTLTYGNPSLSTPNIYAALSYNPFNFNNCPNKAIIFQLQTVYNQLAFHVRYHCSILAKDFQLFRA